ncbi:unnamed protein product [Rotaria sordida]|uniref:Uncharacterized protein n=1 Tax=Rotaria sordida TaxID=392033 RepID=A0A818ZND3_9BILA|nr:unnamed protein product [Rotaria sordida]
MTISRLLFIFLFLRVSIIHTSHFRGGTITWRPFNNTPSGSTVDIQVRQRYSWRRSSVACTDTTIANRGLIGSSYNVICVTGTCSSWTILNTQTHCTDYSVGLDVSSGEKYDTVTITNGISFSIVFGESAWLSNLVVGSSTDWKVVNRINTIVRSDGYINSSPIATTLPVIYKAINQQHVHIVQISDFDGGDILKCRWSTSSTTNYNSYDECGGVCSGVPGAALYSDNCTLVFTLTQAAVYAAVAIQIEDYYNSASATPMSSVPLQFLFYGYAVPSGCSTPPSIIGNRPNRACIGTPIGSTVSEYVIAQIGCSGKTIIDFTSSSPVGMTKSTIENPSTGIYQVILSWIPTSDQYGPQGFCAGAVDDTDVQSEQWCITFLVGFESPSIIRPTIVQGSASPIGTVFQNQTLFSIQTTRSVSRPTRNGTYIHFKDATTNTTVQSYDCGWQSEVTYTGYTIVIRFPTAPWIVGHSYYVMFDSGVASGTEFCGPESAPITDPSFWVFDIWNPGHSSTTTTTTTPPTTKTVTTRPISTTSVNTLLTTTGIVISSTSTRSTTTTTSSTSTSTTTTTTDTIAATTTTGPAVNVMYPKDMEEACQQSVIIMNVATMAAIMPLQAIGMFIVFTKFYNMFNPLRIEVQLRHKRRIKKLNRY